MLNIPDTREIVIDIIAIDTAIIWKSGACLELVLKSTTLLEPILCNILNGFE